MLECDSLFCLSVCSLDPTHERNHRDRLTDKGQADSLGWGALGGGKIEQKGKRTHKHGQQCGDCSGEGIRGTNSNGKCNKK